MLKIGLQNYIARHRRSRPVQSIARACQSFLRWYANQNYALRDNGELLVLQALRGFPLRVFFDVGANVGEWTLAVKEVFPGAEVHAFEISPDTSRTLAEAAGHLLGVRCVNVGLSDQDETIELRHYQQTPSLTTACPFPHPQPFVVTKARTIRGDEYARTNGVQHIDFLKLDVEGMEHRVLAGLSSLLDRGAIDLVQFEYGQVNILTRQLLRDYYELFHRLGYLVGKIYPTYVDFRDYALADEDFIGPNYLACRRERADYIQRLKGTS